jgi:3-hydroxybutyryl-CoA dehydrogenase
MGFQKIGVVGAGAMGLGIAQVCASAGCSVRLFDVTAGAVERALDAVKKDLLQGVSKGKLSQDEADATVARIVPARELQDLSDSDLVVEAIVERLDAKQDLFGALEAIVTPDCVLATNTSSLSVTAIAATCKQPQRVAGWHFFNPVPRMRVVEVIQAPRTNPGVVDALVELSKRIGHRPVATSDSPGFVVNHAGRAFVTEGLKLLSERVADHSVIDGILRSCAGFRMGPLELLDLTGLDVSVPVMESIHSQYYGDDRYRPAVLARTRMVAGLLGRKTKQGFYSYDSAKEGHAITAAAPIGTPSVRVWWPVEGPEAVSSNVASLLGGITRQPAPDHADVILLAPTIGDLSTAIGVMPLGAARTVAIDPYFSGPSGVTLMTSPATSSTAVDALRALFEARQIPVYVVADSPGYVAPRVVACIINLACEIAQQGIASPADIDAAVRLGLGYPAGPFEWGDRLGLRTVLEILQALHKTFGDQRYRPSPWLVRRAALGLSLAAPDRVA